MKEKQICTECGAVLDEDEVYEFDGHIMCADCWEERTVVCDCCNRRVWRENTESDCHITICTRCYDDHYTTCEECGRYIHYDDALYEEGSDYPYCRACFNRISKRPIKPYSYKPSPIFYGEGHFYMALSWRSMLAARIRRTRSFCRMWPMRVQSTSTFNMMVASIEDFFICMNGECSFYLSYAPIAP